MSAQTQQQRAFANRITALEYDLEKIGNLIEQNQSDIDYYNSQLTIVQQRLTKKERAINRRFFKTYDSPFFYQSVIKILNLSTSLLEDIEKKKTNSQHELQFPEFSTNKPLLAFSELAKPIFENKLHLKRLRELALNEKIALGKICNLLKQINYVVTDATRNTKPSFGKRLLFSITKIFSKNPAYQKENRIHHNLAILDNILEDLSYTPEYSLFKTYGKHSDISNQLDMLFTTKLDLTRQKSNLNSEIKNVKALAAECEMPVENESKKTLTPIIKNTMQKMHLNFPK